MAIYRCSVCDTIYDEEKEGKKWDELSASWACHVCESGKSLFQCIDETPLRPASPAASRKRAPVSPENPRGFRRWRST